MPIQAYQTAFRIWLNANRSQLLDRLDGDTDLAKKAREEWMKMSEDEKDVLRKKANISAKCLRGRTRRLTKEYAVKKSLPEIINPNDALSKLTSGIVVRHILPRVPPKCYAQLHLVSRRFHRLLCDKADKLPKQDFTYLSFQHDWEAKFDFVRFTRAYSGSFKGVCRNFDGSQDDKGPSLEVLLRHQRLTYELSFHQGFKMKNVMNMLIHLAKKKYFCMTDILFECDMDGVIEGQLNELLAHSPSHIKTFCVNRHTYVGRGIFTDALVAPIIASGRVRVLGFHHPVCVTDLTLDRLPPLIDDFFLWFEHTSITAHGVYRFIQRFRKDPRNLSGELTVCAFLEKPLRALITPDKAYIEELMGHESTKWTFYKVPGNASSPTLEIEFEFS